MSATSAAPATTTVGTARQLFEELTELGPLRVISVNGPSVFEAICELSSFGVADGWLNAITSEYHWHVRLEGVRHLRTRDEIYARSGRRVLYFELREGAGEEPFLLVYLHRDKGEEFDQWREQRFAAVHERYADGRELEVLS